MTISLLLSLEEEFFLQSIAGGLFVVDSVLVCLLVSFVLFFFFHEIQLGTSTLDTISKQDPVLSLFSPSAEVMKSFALCCQSWMPYHHEIYWMKVMKCCDTSTESQDGELGAKRHWGHGGIGVNKSLTPSTKTKSPTCFYRGCLELSI